MALKQLSRDKQFIHEVRRPVFVFSKFDLDVWHKKCAMYCISMLRTASMVQILKIQQD